MPSPVVELNRAVAVSMAAVRRAGLEIVDSLQHEKALQQYHLLPSVRGDLLFKIGAIRRGAPRAGTRRVDHRNARERELLLERAAAANRRD